MSDLVWVSIISGVPATIGAIAGIINNFHLGNVSKAVDGLASKREAELTIAKVDKAAAEGELKGRKGE